MGKREGERGFGPGFVFMPISVVEPNEHWAPSHKRVPAVAIESVEAAILASFLKRLRAGVVFSARG
jgi:hypothetical protein